jgi:ferric-dicitrate binding protein FerR (iron transport regulator)
LEWLKESDENRNHFSEYRKLFDLSLSLPYNGKFSKRRSVNWKQVNDKISSSKWRNHEKARKLPFYLKIAAAVLFVFFAGGSTFYWLLKSTPNQNLGNIEYEVNAPRGGKSEITLTDGTKVWLNAGTRLRYKADYGLNSRIVWLDGEGYFAVVKNPKKPFIVRTSGLQIKAFGTSFNVKAYPEEKFVTTTLVEGIVNIEGTGVNLSLKPKEVMIFDKAVSKPLTINNKSTANITKNTPPKSAVKEIAIISKPKVATNVNTNIYTSWKDNLWIIESESLKNIAIILERKFNVTVDIKSSELNQYTFTGTFNNETLEQILDIIKLTAPLNFQINKGVVTITEEQKRKATYRNFIK